MQKYEYIYENWISGRLYTVNTDPVLVYIFMFSHIILGHMYVTVTSFS